MEYTQKNPFDIEQDTFIHALKGKRRTVLEYIIESESGKTFKEIASGLEIKPTTLAYHLKILVDRKLLEKRFRSMDGRRDYSLYNVTEKGKRSFILMNEIPKRVKDETDLPALGKYPVKIEIIQDSRRPRSLRIEKMKEGP